MLLNENFSAARKVLPGVAISATVAAAAVFLSEHRGGPSLLYALLIGMSFFFLSKDATAAPGINFSARTILRIGVALLGVRISVGQILDLGAIPIAIVFSSVALTLVFSIFAAKVLKLPAEQAMLGGGSVAICGASAALAISAALPKSEARERNTLFTVIAVTLLSTLAMVLYPLIIDALRLRDTVAGVLLGATVHDVAQVVGAGYLISPHAGVVATYVKLLRVAMLLPVVMVVSASFRKAGDAQASADRPPLLPGFLFGFLALAIVNSLGWVPASLVDATGELSRWCLITAIAALGMKTSLQELATVGLRPLALLVANSVFLLALVLWELKLTGQF